MRQPVYQPELYAKMLVSAPPRIKLLSKPPPVALLPSRSDAFGAVDRDLDPALRRSSTFSLRKPSGTVTMA